MDPVKPTPELFEAVRRVLVLTSGRTWAEVAEDGGPSSATMKNLKNGTKESISERTLKKLGDAYGWQPDTEFRLVSDDPDVRSAALKSVLVGPPRNSPQHGRTSRRGQASTVQLSAIDKFINTMQEALDELREAMKDQL